jgi:photosystem II stability/assembly factor-like uncharacterized protein
MKKVLLVLLPILLTAQACNFLFGDLSGNQGSGSKGVFLSTDGGQTWQEANKINKTSNLAGAQVLRIVLDRTNSKNLLAVAANSGVYASNDGAGTWFALLPNFAGYDAFLNPDNNKEIFAAGARGGQSVLLKSADSGGTWTQIYSEPPGKTVATSVVFDPRNPAEIFVGLSSGTVLKSIDYGANWNSVVDFKDRVSKLVTTADGHTLYVLGRTDGLRRTLDGGRTWTNFPLTVKPGPGQYNDFVLDSVGDLYVATDKGLFKSSDSGATWVQLLLPATPEANDVSAVAINPQNPRQIFAAIRSTVYRSDDFGATWRTVSLPTNQIISVISIDSAEPNRIYVGLK